ncbi:MAG: hypothetical protein KA270_09615 [Saprospiraceae bacterium]|nr:hypothetical protein [Saprospiraceae bacterium]MBP6235713.1 hypothetical protein [Saprospiraceae bacterium]MBP6567413.1 hypothetical protein [Saprospiraceae bacterium]
MKYYKEILIIEAIAFLGLWIIDEYIATLLTFIAVPIFGGIFIVSLIAEKIERSRIQREYFYMMAGLAIIPIIIFIGIFLFNGGTSFEWGM